MGLEQTNPAAAASLSADERLYAAIAETGFYPAAVSSQISSVMSGEPCLGSIVVQDVHVDIDDGPHMEVETLIISDTRLIFWCGYEQAAEEDGQPAELMAQSRVIPLRNVSDVRVVTRLSDPAHFAEGDVPDSVKVIFVLNQLDHLELDVITCDDPEHAEPHGFAGDIRHDALIISETRRAVGDGKIGELLEFGAVASRLVGMR